MEGRLNAVTCRGRPLMDTYGDESAGYYELSEETVDAQLEVELLLQTCAESNGEEDEKTESPTDDRLQPEDAEERAARERLEEATRIHEEARALMDSWKRVGELYVR